jgi:Type VI secretion system (T6SS), amidase effector protein 4
MLLPNGPTSTTSGLHTVKGGDGLNYAYRVSEMRDYLNKTVGPAPVVLTGNQITPDAIKGQTGIIAFSVPFSDATGHFDLWDGNAPAHAEYFSRATKVEFWPTQ